MRGTILGILLLLSACALAAAALMTGDEGVLLASLTLVLCNAGVGTLYLIMHGKEAIMQIGIVEKIMERRRIATAAALAERYSGIDLTNTPEALPTPLYHCAGCSSYQTYTADRLYWVDEKPLLSAGWYCEGCVDKLKDRPLDERLNMELFLIVASSDPGAN